MQEISSLFIIAVQLRLESIIHNPVGVGVGGGVGPVVGGGVGLGVGGGVGPGVGGGVGPVVGSRIGLRAGGGVGDPGDRESTLSTKLLKNELSSCSREATATACNTIKVIVQNFILVVSKTSLSVKAKRERNTGVCCIINGDILWPKNYYRKKILDFIQIIRIVLYWFLGIVVSSVV